MRIKLVLGLAMGLIALLFISACSDETHEEKMAREEQEKQEQAEIAASAVKGVGNALSGVGSDAAESLSQGVTDVISGLGRGVEKGTEFPVNVQESLAERGVSSTLATRNMSSPEINAVSVYVTFDQDTDAVLQLRAYDKDNKEIGRSNKIPVQIEADEGGYLHFSFDSQTPLTRVETMLICETKKSSAQADEAQEAGNAESEEALPDGPDAF